MRPNNYKNICHLPGHYSKAAFPKAAFVVKKNTPPYFKTKVLLASSLLYYDSQNPIITLNSSRLLTKINLRDIQKKILQKKKTNC